MYTLSLPSHPGAVSGLVWLIGLGAVFKFFIGHILLFT